MLSQDEVVCFFPWYSYYHLICSRQDLRNFPWYQLERIHWLCCNEFQGSFPFSFNFQINQPVFALCRRPFSSSVNITGHVTTSSGSILRVLRSFSSLTSLLFHHYSIQSEFRVQWDDSLVVSSLFRRIQYLVASFQAPLKDEAPIQ
jgi:hypothetical protein